MNGTFNVAVHALVYLNHKGCCLSSEALAENICTNSARVRKIMAKLKKADFVDTREGITGGYQLKQKAENVSLAEVAEALDIKFVDVAWHSGDADMSCLVASGMAGIMDQIYEQLNQQCKQELKKISIQDIDQKIFGALTEEKD